MNMHERRLHLLERALDAYLPVSDLAEKTVYEAARYSLLGGGKRIRPVLLLEFSALFGVETDRALPFACALEYLHTYSLIHDDLPCMDDDKLRRGRPTNHVVYGEAMALLAGDALLNRAYEILLGGCKDPREIACAAQIAACAGVHGMIGGQAIDLAGEGKPMDLQTLLRMHEKKTGALIRAACVGGTMLGTADRDFINAAQEYARNVGLAFQIVDDILDVVGSAEKLGKQTGMDARQGKNTFVSLLGLEQAKIRAAEYTEAALNALNSLPKSGFLRDFTHKLLHRSF